MVKTKKKAGLLQELKESIPAYILILPTIAILIIFFVYSVCKRKIGRAHV